jgi:glycosyltransferase involved in cell wall biosynthesis
LSRRAPRLLFLVTEDWYFCSHRMPLARAARDAGFRVTVACRVDRHKAAIEKEGFRLVATNFSRRSLNPLRELALVREIAKAYRAEKPDIVHHVSLKPVLYGSIAARLAGVPAVVNAFTGLGYAFIARDAKGRAVRALVTRLLRFALGGLRAKTVTQNDDDAATLLQAGLVKIDDLVLIRGSGVDLSVFKPTVPPPGEPLVVLPARLLWDKGVGEFVEAARRLKAAGVSARFALVGESDPENHAAVPPARLREWKAEGVVEIWGRREDMPAVLAECHLVCLPSYREGLPKSLLEAAAGARACVTTDVPGCRDAVLDGETGLLVPARDAGALAKALRSLIEDPERRARMGEHARRWAQEKFSQEKVAAETLALYRELLAEAA